MSTDADAPVEAADFYIGRGDQARYLGTTNDGHPDALNIWGRFQYFQDEFTEFEFRAAVTRIADHTRWPHPYTKSIETPWTYCWSLGTLYVYRYGVEMAQIRSNYLAWQAPQERLGDGRVIVTRDRSAYTLQPRRGADFPHVGTHRKATT